MQPLVFSRVLFTARFTQVENLNISYTAEFKFPPLHYSCLVAGLSSWLFFIEIQCVGGVLVCNSSLRKQFCRLRVGNNL